VVNRQLAAYLLQPLMEKCHSECTPAWRMSKICLTSLDESVCVAAVNLCAEGHAVVV
jgi:hypothetical protein